MYYVKLRKQWHNYCHPAEFLRVPGVLSAADLNQPVACKRLATTERRGGGGGAKGELLLNGAARVQYGLKT